MNKLERGATGESKVKSFQEKKQTDLVQWSLTHYTSLKKRDATCNFVCRMTRKEKTQRKEICSINRYESEKQMNSTFSLTLTLTLTLIDFFVEKFKCFG